MGEEGDPKAIAEWGQREAERRSEQDKDATWGSWAFYAARLAKLLQARPGGRAKEMRDR